MARKQRKPINTDKQVAALKAEAKKYAVKVKDQKLNGEPIPAWVFHDLRRTCRSFLSTQIDAWIELTYMRQLEVEGLPVDQKRMAELRAILHDEPYLAMAS